MMFLPDTKTGRKTLYLSDVALGILEDLPQVKGNPYVIPGEVKGEPRADLKRPWAAILRAANLDKASVETAEGNKQARRRKSGQARSDTAYASTTCATPLRPSAWAVRLACQWSASCSATPKPGRRSAMPT